MEYLTRKDAAATNKLHFYIGPCAYGHDVGRYTSSGHCVGCVRRRNRRLAIGEELKHLAKWAREVRAQNAAPKRNKIEQLYETTPWVAPPYRIKKRNPFGHNAPLLDYTNMTDGQREDWYAKVNARIAMHGSYNRALYKHHALGAKIIESAKAAIAEDNMEKMVGPPSRFKRTVIR